MKADTYNFTADFHYQTYLNLPLQQRPPRLHLMTVSLSFYTLMGHQNSLLIPKKMTFLRIS